MTTSPANPSPPPSSKDEKRSIILSSELFKGAQSVQIEHARQRYQLRITRENKLILTK